MACPANNDTRCCYCVSDRCCFCGKTEDELEPDPIVEYRATTRPTPTFTAAITDQELIRALWGESTSLGKPKKELEPIYKLDEFDDDGSEENHDP